MPYLPYNNDDRLAELGAQGIPTPSIEDDSTPAPSARIQSAAVPDPKISNEPFSMPARAPIAAPDLLSGKEIADQRDSQDRSKRLGMLVGSIGDQLSGIQTFGNIYSGHLNQKSDSGARLAQNLNSAMVDPAQRQAQIYSMYKQAIDNQSTQTQFAQNEALKDPRSTQSKSLKALYGKYDLDVSPEDSGASLQTKYGPISDVISSARDQDNALELAEEKNKGTFAVAQERGDTQKMLRDQMNGQRADTRDAKQTEAQGKAYTDLRAKLEAARSNPLVQQSMRNKLAAQNALAMVDGKDPNSLSNQQIALFSDELAKIATGGIPGEHGVQMLMPDSSASRIAKLQSFFANKPEPAQAGAFLKDNISYLKELKTNSEKNISDYQGNIAKGYRGRVRPEDYQEAQTDYSLGAPSEQKQASPSQMPSQMNQLSPKDQATVDPYAKLGIDHSAMSDVQKSAVQNMARMELIKRQKAKVAGQ